MERSRKIEPKKYAELCLKWCVWITILTVILVWMQGCADKDRRFDPAPVGFTNDTQTGALRPKRATAQELLDAANNGVVPEWFNEAERKAVQRIKE